MAGTETYGGCCPQCLKAMEQKHETSWSGFMFDACPHCGFIYAEVNGAEKDKEEAWEAILDHARVGSRVELIAEYPQPEYLSPVQSDFYPSIFNYSNDEGTLLIYRMLFKQYGSRKREYQVEGQRVYWHNTREQEGTLMAYSNGVVSILWDEHKGSKIPYFEYDAKEVGNTILLVTPIDSPPVIGEDDWSNEEVFAGINYLQEKGNNVRDLRERFMDADTEHFLAIESNDHQRHSRATENLQSIVDEVRTLLDEYRD